MNPSTPEAYEILGTLKELLDRVDLIRRTRTSLDCGPDLERLLRDVRKLKTRKLGSSLLELALLYLLQEELREMAAGLGCQLGARTSDLEDFLIPRVSEIEELVRRGTVDDEPPPEVSRATRGRGTPRGCPKGSWASRTRGEH